MKATVMHAAKRSALRLFPWGYQAFQRRRQAQRRIRWLDAQMRREEVIRKIVTHQGPHVAAGPFSGMMFLPVSREGGVPARLLGCYEAELHDLIEEAVSRDYDWVINIGCGEGYYAVGMALRLPEACVYAFDVDPVQRALCLALAATNGVADRVHVCGECTTERLREVADPTDTRLLVICDCEGCEMELVRIDKVPRLATCDILVEMHDFIDRTISATMCSRFSQTHDIRVVSTVARDPDGPWVPRFLDHEERTIAVDELRPAPMEWAMMTARTPTKSTGAGI